MSEKLWVIRNESGEIVSTFRGAQPDYKGEKLDLDDPEVVAFHNRTHNPPVNKSDIEAKLDAVIRKLNVTVTEQEIEAEKAR